MRGSRPLSWGVLVAGLTAWACGGAKQSSREPSPTPFELTIHDDQEAETPWEACLGRAVASGDPVSDVEKLGRTCGTPTGQRPMGPARKGRQSAAGAVDRYTFHVDQAGSCVRAYAVGDQGVKVLTVEITNEAGTVMATSKPGGGVAAAPHRAPLCLDDAGVYTVEVAVAEGAGDYALQVWNHEAASLEPEMPDVSKPTVR